MEILFYRGEKGTRASCQRRSTALSIEESRLPRQNSPLMKIIFNVTYKREKRNAMNSSIRDGDTEDYDILSCGLNRLTVKTPFTRLNILLLRVFQLNTVLLL